MVDTLLDASTIRNIAVFIDFENIAYAQVDHTKARNQYEQHVKEVKADMLKVMEYLKGRGRIIMKKAYADWGKDRYKDFNVFKETMLENSIELIEMPTSSVGGPRKKNYADIKLVVDALETAITKSYIDTIVVVSGDSDFSPLISKLREYNKYVIVIGQSGKTSKLLKGYCDELRYFSDIRAVDEEVQQLSEDELPYGFQLLTKAVRHYTGQDKIAWSSTVKQYMQQLDSSFTEERYGFDKWHDFLKSAEESNMVQLLQDPKRGNNAYFLELGAAYKAKSGGRGRQKK